MSDNQLQSDGGDLRGRFKAAKVNPAPGSKVIALVVAVAAFAALGAYSYEAGVWHTGPKPAVASDRLPSVPGVPAR